MHKTLNIGHNRYFVRPEYYNKMLGPHHRMSRKKAKRFRIAFTTEQINYMEEQFKMFPYINSSHRQEVALALNIPEKAVKVWFQNRRMREKKDTIAKEIDIEASNLMQLDIFNKESSFSNKASNSLQKGMTSLCDEVNNFNYGKKLNSAIDLNSELSKYRPTSIQSHCSKSSVNYSKLEEIVKFYEVDFKDKITNHTNYAKPVFNKHRNMKKNDGENRSNADKSKEQKPAEELSLNLNMNDSKVGQIREPSESLNDPTYIYMVPDVSSQMQPYYSTGGMVWNPINVVPAVNPVSVKPILSNSVINHDNQ